MLDDLKFINDYDAGDALGVAGKQAPQLLHDFAVSLSASKPVTNIVLGGMGGSGWPALILNSWPGLSVPLEVVRTYTLPKYVNQSTLYIASSYSGNTEETLAGLDEAQARGAQIVVMAAGGKLVERAKKDSLPLFLLPTGLQPRMSSLYFLAAFVQLLAPLGLISSNASTELSEASDWLAQQNANWLAEIPTEKNLAKQLAEQLAGKSVIVYSGPLLFPAANKWKICINENAKNLAWANQYPEFNHNEFIGWSSHPVDKPFAVVEIQSDLEDARVQKRFALSQKLLSGKRPSPVVISPQGDSILKQILWSFNLGDYVSIYLALLNGVDPTPVDLVEAFKQQL